MKARAVSASAPPGGSFDLGEVPIGDLLTFEASGVDAGETPRVGGRSLGIVIGGVTSETLPIFAQRLGRWSRPPGQLTHSHAGGRAAARLHDRPACAGCGVPVGPVQGHRPTGNRDREGI